MIAYCGLDCFKCDASLATQADNGRIRKETAEKWSKMYHFRLLRGLKE